MNASGQDPPVFRCGKLLPILLGALSLLLIAATVDLLFIRLPLIQESVQELAGRLASAAAANQPLTVGLPADQTSSFPDAAGQFLLLLALPCWIACWLLMVYRLARKAQRLGGNRMRTSPRRCVLSFLLPVGNMWMPVNALLDINAILSPDRRTPGIWLIWTAWAVNVPVALLTFLYTLSLPVSAFIQTFREWGGGEGADEAAALEEGLRAMFGAPMTDMLVYNGSIFILCILASGLTVLYLDSRLPPSCRRHAA